VILCAGRSAKRLSTNYATTPDATQLFSALCMQLEAKWNYAIPQGQRPLKRCSSNDFQQVVIAPTTTAAFHDETCAVGMLLQE
jgi:hypothetical protein